ncbi:MAG: DUF3299 domain-containing protein [Planctomycetota bacterium]|nr:MAG: DUF3299 domain-containing protein [Planctomycetota bacterium]
MKRVAWMILLLGCPKPPAPPAAVETLAFQSLGAFEYQDKMKLPDDVTKWNGKLVNATGFMNPVMGSPRNLTSFLLVKDRASCCFGKRPQINHFIEVKLKAGQKTDYSPDPVTVRGVLQVDDRWDGDWQVGLYWMDGAEVMK